VHEVVLNSGWDTVVFAVPLIGFLFVGFFRLDELFSASKREPRARTRRAPAGMDADGEPIICDPDGRPWHQTRRSE
jgi:hypothetical protein